MDLRLVLAAILCLEMANSLLMQAPAKKEPKVYSEDEISDLWDNIISGNGVTTTTKAPVVEKSAQNNLVQSDPQGCGWPGIAFQFKFGDEETEHTEFGEYKWTVAILDKSNGSYIAGGSLIHPNVVLTVGARFRAGGSWVARAGEWRLSTNADLLEHQDREVKDVVIHPEAHITKFNVGLMIVEAPFVTGSHIGFICLPPLNGYTPAGELCLATGWGHEKYDGGKVQDVMKLVELPMVEKSECERRLRPYVGLSFDLHWSSICAGGVPGRDTCKKDGGSPLVCPYKEQPDRYYQAGIVSAGVRCGLDVPAVYANVAAMRSWIDDHMRAKGYGIESYTT